MWFCDDGRNWPEYDHLRQYIRPLEREYRELKDWLRAARQALEADPESELKQARVNYLERRIQHLERNHSWLARDIPIEAALFFPPHG